VFQNLRTGTVALLLVIGMVVTGTLLGAVIVGAASGGATPDPITVRALTAATRSLPPDWVVGRGDTFTAIAVRTHLSATQLQLLNPQQDPNALRAGQRLRLHLRP